MAEYKTNKFQKCCIMWGCRNGRTNGNSMYCNKHIKKTICKWGVCRNSADKADGNYCADHIGHIDKQQCRILGCFNTTDNNKYCDNCLANEWLCV